MAFQHGRAASFGYLGDGEDIPTVFAVELEDGTIVNQVPGTVYADPDGSLYTIMDDGSIQYIQSDTGAPIGTIPGPSVSQIKTVSSSSDTGVMGDITKSLANIAGSIFGYKYGTQYKLPAGYSALGMPVKKSNTTTWLLIGGGILAASFILMSGGRKKSVSA